MGDVETDIHIQEVTTDGAVESVAESVPTWVVLKITLPKVEGAGVIDAQVVDSERFELEVLGAYWLDVSLPHKVDDEGMECSFIKASRVLTVRLPVEGPVEDGG